MYIIVYQLKISENEKENALHMTQLWERVEDEFLNKFKKYVVINPVLNITVKDGLSFPIPLQIKKPLILVPMLVPGLEYLFETLVESLSEMGVSDQIRSTTDSD